MKNLFEHTASTWVRYSEYEWKTAEDDVLYLTPAPKATPNIYNPLKEAQEIVLAALQVGRMCISKDSTDAEIQKEILDFVRKYGLFGLMTALPTTPDFMKYEAVYLPKNHFLKEETMTTENYLSLFFPFDKLDIVKHGMESMWNIEDDLMMMALSMTMADRPMAINMSFQREYAERYDWLKQQFKDWTFNAVTSFLYYNDYDSLDEDNKRLMQQGMAAFGGNAPTYHIALLDKPTLVWDFHSLLLGIQMMFSFMLTDENKPLRLCKQCMSAFIATRPSAVFCSPRCKNQYNVYKNRAKKNKPDNKQERGIK